MTMISDRYRTNAARFSSLVEAIPTDRWASPSPCKDWNAIDILQHVVSTELDHLGRMSLAPDGAVDGLEPDKAWPVVRDLVQAALDDPARAGTTYEGVFGTTTLADSIDQFYSFDLVVHAWDLAKATGMTDFEEMPPDEISTITKMLAPLGDKMRQPGVFGPEIPVADDADPQTKLLAFVGRRA